MTNFRIGDRVKIVGPNARVWEITDFHGRRGRLADLETVEGYIPEVQTVPVSLLEREHDAITRLGEIAVAMAAKAVENERQRLQIRELLAEAVRLAGEAGVNVTVKERRAINRVVRRAACAERSVE